MSSRSGLSPEARGRQILSGKGGGGKKTFAPRSRAPAPLIERIERALVLAAYVVVRHGPVYAPLLDRLERELEVARRNDPTERAKRILEAYAADGSQMQAGATTSGRAREQSQTGSLRGRHTTTAQHKRDSRPRS